MNFAAVAQKEVGETPLKVVQIDGQVLLKIIKHCKECMPSLVTGQLLGLDIGSTLEVTNSFPFPSRATADADEEGTDGASYQLEMMRCLREVNVDNNTVGWYQSTYLGSYQTVELIETFLSYQENIKRCVCIVYDPYRSMQGCLALKALKLKDSFMEVYRAGDLSSETLTKSGITWQDIFQEIPVSISNPTLHATLVQQLETDTSANQADFDRLVLSTNPYLEKNLEFMTECLDDLQTESQKLSFYQRTLARQQQQQAQWLQKRRAENFQRRAAGEEALPEEEPSNPVFKALPEPSKLESLLITDQINNYCSQINQFAAQGMEKMYLMQGLHTDN